MNITIDYNYNTTTITNTSNYQIDNRFDVLIFMGYFIIGVISFVILVFISNGLLKNIKCICNDKLKTWLINNHPNFRHLQSRYQINSVYNQNQINSEHVIVEILGKIEIPKEINYHDECAICFEEIGSDKIYKLNCNHHFHLKCWEQWDKHSAYSNCPMCRYGI